MVYITMNLTKEWFNKIKSGKKTHEYRLANAYWRKRIKIYMIRPRYMANQPALCLSWGYPKKDDQNKQLLAVITKAPEIINGKNTDLKVDAPVFDIEFKLLGV